MSLQYKDFESAKLNHRPMRRSPMKRGTKRLRARPDPRAQAWSKAVLKRDGHKCQWPGGCNTGDKRIDPHHLAERSQRPDLKYDVDNGLSLCRTHHDWIPQHRAEAIRLGLIKEETYELARKSGAK